MTIWTPVLISIRFFCLTKQIGSCRDHHNAIRFSDFRNTTKNSLCVVFSDIFWLLGVHYILPGLAQAGVQINWFLVFFSCIGAKVHLWSLSCNIKYPPNTQFECLDEKRHLVTWAFSTQRVKHLSLRMVTANQYCLESIHKLIAIIVILTPGKSLRL